MHVDNAQRIFKKVADMFYQRMATDCTADRTLEVLYNLLDCWDLESHEDGDVIRFYMDHCDIVIDTFLAVIYLVERGSGDVFIDRIDPEILAWLEGCIDLAQRGF